MSPGDLTSHAANTQIRKLVSVPLLFSASLHNDQRSIDKDLKVDPK
jgi:hypothetical protein